jgi:hypothetical protein
MASISPVKNETEKVRPRVNTGMTTDMGGFSAVNFKIINSMVDSRPKPIAY